MGPTASRRRAAALPPEQRREVLVEATLPLLLEHGTAVTTRQIAEAADVAEGTIFRVFPDKESLISAVIEAAFDPEPFEHGLRAIPEDLPLEERLRRAVVLLQDRIGALGRLMTATGLTRPPGAAEGATHRAPPPTSIEAIAGLFLADAPRLRRGPGEAAQLLRALTLAGTHPLMVAEPVPAAEIVDLLLHGLLVPGSDEDEGDPAC